MELTGLIFGVVALAWLAYLVPWFLSQRDQSMSDETESTIGFGHTMRLLRSGSPAPEDLDLLEAEVSTPLMRQAARREASRRARRAARSRTFGLLVLIGTLITVVGLAGLGRVAWWVAPAVIGGIVVFLVLSRVSTALLNRRLDARLADVELADDEQTIGIAVGEFFFDDEDAHEHSVELSGPIEPMAGSLWDPIPVTTPTYVSRSTAPRTVRTIDLSAPVVAERKVPVTADPEVSDKPEDLRDVG